MANSKYEYVKAFESDDRLLPSTWIVIRIDGRGFRKFSEVHNFEKPNDERALQLMNDCAKVILADQSEIVFAYGVSDEYSFVIHKSSTLFQRRASKLVSVIVSLFASAYVMKWPEHFPEKKISYSPCFDGRAVCYPADNILRDYLSWRQVDCHINNQYNTCYWNLIKSGYGPSQAYNELQGTQAEQKNELLFQRFKINYNALPEMFRKGSSVFRTQIEDSNRTEIVVEHCDIISDTFWDKHPYILQETKDATRRPKQGKTNGVLASGVKSV